MWFEVAGHPAVLFAAGLIATAFGWLIVEQRRNQNEQRRTNETVRKLDKIVSPWFEEPGPEDHHLTLPGEVRQLRTDLTQHVRQEEESAIAEARDRQHRQSRLDAHLDGISSSLDSHLSDADRRFGALEARVDGLEA